MVHSPFSMLFVQIRSFCRQRRLQPFMLYIVNYIAHLRNCRYRRVTNYSANAPLIEPYAAQTKKSMPVPFQTDIDMLFSYIFDKACPVVFRYFVRLAGGRAVRYMSLLIPVFVRRCGYAIFCLLGLRFQCLLFALEGTVLLLPHNKCLLSLVILDSQVDLRSCLECPIRLQNNRA